MGKRKVISIREAIEIFSEGVYLPGEEDRGLLYWVEVDNMGFCKDGVTRYYMFDLPDGTPAIAFKH